jgi:sulfhydrogenase subunit beta (sulfur reductase)
MPSKVVSFERFATLIGALQDSGYTVVGPTVGEKSIVYDEIRTINDLPIGMREIQNAGSYQLVQGGDDALFAYTVGPTTWKKYLFPPHETLLSVTSTDGNLLFAAADTDSPRYAFLGIRPCELAAISIQDKVFISSTATDPKYASARAGMFTVAVNCAVAGGTCFCTSMGTGPRAEAGYDLVLTEIIDGDTHEFVIESGSHAGESVLEKLEGRPATETDASAVDSIAADTADHMGRSMQTDDVYDVLVSNLTSDQWDEVALRCLSCTNCTLVCPTCFCSTMEDISDLKGTATRQRRWDSCFTMDFTNLHSHAVRSTTATQYRQWITHKLAYWQDQFDVIGCVGCGRCITWCPPGIDITEEVKKLRTAAKAVAV